MIKNNFKGRKNLISIFVFSFFFLFIIGNISAAPPVSTVQQFSEGYVLKYPSDSIVEQNKSYEFEFHIFNISNGLPVTTGVTCWFHLYNATGKHQLEMTDSVPSHNWDYSFNIKAENFTTVGEYYYITQCNGTDFGGYVEQSFTVTPRGLESDVGFYIILLLLTYGIGFVGFFGKNQWVSIIGGMSMMVFGIFVLTQGITIYLNWVTQVISYISMGLGAMFILIPLIEWVEEL